MRHVERTSAAGQLFRIYDEAGLHQMEAAVWLGGREYTADDKGEILVPFSTDPAPRLVVLRAGNRSSMARFAHDAESYGLRCNVHVDREALIAGKKAKLLVRPQLRLADRTVTLSLLQDPVLTVVATDLDGLETTKEVPLTKLADDIAFEHELNVPERLRFLAVSLRAKVKDIGGKDVDLAAFSERFELNRIDENAATKNVLLVRTQQGYAVELRGKDGEPGVDKACTVELTHRDFRDTVTVSLQSDAAGRVQLGALDGIDSILVKTPTQWGSFALTGDACVHPDIVQARAGTPIRVAYSGKARTVTRAAFSLLANDRDAFANLALEDGFVVLRDLPVGTYSLTLHETGEAVTVRVVDGDLDGRWIVGKERILEASDPAPLQIAAARRDDDVVVHVSNPSAATRVHVVATRYWPAYDMFADLRGNDPRPPIGLATPPKDSQFEVGRALGDEYRYVLERRFAAKFPGNMLDRPSLLVNPWKLDDDSHNEAVGLGGRPGGEFRPSPNSKRIDELRSAQGATKGGSASNLAAQPNLDFLSTTSTQFFNLLPDKNGEIRIPRAALGGDHLVQVLALDGDQAVQTTLVLDEKPLTTRARRLQQALDGSQHFAQLQHIEFVAGGATVQLGDPRATQTELFDSLSSVHRALATISQNGDWSKFAFVLQWPTTSPEQKLALYEQYACHELHFFLYQKDREFFDAVVRPALLCKRDKTFLDRWLLGDDLRRFLDPWAFAQLNLVEKILLARRLDDEGRGSIARLVREQLELRPVQVEALERLVTLALKTQEFAEEVSRDGLVPAEKANEPEQSKESAFDSNQWNSAVGLGGGAGGRVAGRDRNKNDAEELAKKAKDEQAGAQTGSDDFFLGGTRRAEGGEQLQAEAELRQNVRQLYRAVDPTRLLVEQNYWQRRLQQATPDVVAPSQFWADYATAPAGQPFVSAAVLQANGSFLEMMMALAVLDLPFEAGKHEFVTDGDRTTLKAATPLLLVKKEVTATEAAADQAPLLLGENFFRLDDRYRYENGEQRDAFVTDEFLTDVAYGCQVVVTNPTSSKRIANVLLQVPAGAVPVQKGFWTRGVTVELQPYATAQLEYAFYFPGSGDFAHYPAHAAEKGKLAANASARTLHVVDVPSKIDTGSWEHVSQEGSAAEVLTFLDNHNVQRLELPKIAWRMKDRAFFTEATKRLRDRHVYDDTLWSYAVLHRDPAATREYLEHQDGFLAQCGAFLQSRLVDIDPVERKAYQHVELDPLVHQRAHQLGSQRRIGNRDLAQQYGALMNILGYKPQLASEDWIATTYYFLLQDRVEDALAAFAKVQQNEVTEQLQYDYLAAYLCFYTADTGKARRIAERYRDYPVAHWNKRFGQIRQQLDEIDGKAVPSTEPTGDSLAATAPSLEMLLDGKTVRLSHKNLAQCEVRYYPVDVEFAFSAQPFASSDRSAAAYVQPILSQQVGLAATTAETAFELPAQFHNKNVLVEVRAAGLVRSQTFFANALAVRFLESYGQVAVSEAGGNKPLPKTYVKVFARLPNGQVRFHKDGYTDLRGRFDYASLSDDPNRGATRYAVLVMHEQRGAVIRELDPPTR
ncbi:MAG: hypothetical protein KDC48_00985 [Planctomycetes bacterium]|nr:hypothetical protein [Planctomycetota bacterium]